MPILIKWWGWQNEKLKYTITNNLKISSNLTGFNKKVVYYSMIMENELERSPAFLGERDEDDDGMGEDKTFAAPEDEEGKDDLDADDEDDEEEDMEM